MFLQVLGTQSTSVFVACVSGLFSVWLVVATLADKRPTSHAVCLCPSTLLSELLSVQLIVVCTVCRLVPCRWQQCSGCVRCSWLVVHYAKGSLQG